MHPLWFPNSGIRAKVFIRKIGFKLRVMRLNRVELFYALVAVIDSESRRCLRGRGGHMPVVYMQRWLATARPPIGAVGHGLATCKGRPAAARPPAMGCRLQGQQPTRGGHPRARPVVASPQGPTGSGQPARGCRPLAGRLPVAKGSCRLRRGNGDDDVVRVKEG
ncbi:hypothetical protein BHM03_00062387 [Ensete ventricosum]|nr:hypothetical protein BHM03_00062387 [Ensete ventricosum]